MVIKKWHNLRQMLSYPSPKSVFRRWVDDRVRFFRLRYILISEEELLLAAGLWDEIMENHCFTSCTTSSNRCMMKNCFYPTFVRLQEFSLFLQSIDKTVNLKPRNMSSSGNVSESGWTMYLDNSSINRSTTHFDIDHTSSLRASRITFTGNEEESSSMLSDASSGQQLLPLPDKEQDTPTSASYPARMRGFHGKRRDLDCVSSCSCTDRSPTKYKLKIVENEEEAEYCSWLQDTASSSDHSAEKGVIEGEVNMEEKHHQQPPEESLVDLQPHFQCLKAGVTGKV